MRLRRVIHSGAHNLVEHPYRDLAIVALVVIINLTAKHARPSGLAAADDEISSEQRMPRILYPPDIRLVIILIGTCTTGRALTSPSRRMRPSRAPSSHLRMAASSRCPRSADSIIDTSVARRSRRASRPCRHILRGWKRDPVLARWISALTAAVAAPSDVQEGPSSAVPIGQLVGRSDVGSSFGQPQFAPSDGIR